MFPIRWDFPFRRKDGKLSTIQDEINSGGGGGYTLPTASANTKGGIKIGNGATMDGETMNVDSQLPTYGSEQAGKVLKVGSAGSLEWGESGGGGGSDLYLDVETNCNLTQNGWNGNYFDTSSLTGKTITSWVMQNAPSNSQYYAAEGMMNPGGQTSMLIYTTQGSSPKKITIRFYYK